MKNRFKWSLLAVIALVATVAMAADKYISSSGNIVLKTAASKSVNLQDTVYATQAGKLGVGVSSPASLLDVRDTTGSVLTLGKASAFSAGQYSEILFKEGASELSKLKWNADTNEVQLINKIAGPMSFYTSNAEKMRIASDGKVGIGTNAPSAGLTVVRSVSDEWTGLFKNYSASAYGLSVDLSGSTTDFTKYALAVYTGSGTGMVVKNNGFVGIGTLSPVARLDVYDAAGSQIYIRDGGANTYFEQVGGNTGNSTWRTTASAVNMRVISNVNGVQVVPNGNSWAAISDRNLKERITKINNGIDTVKALNPVTYYFKNDIKTKHLGFIAQEVKEVIPELVHVPKNYNPRKVTGLDNGMSLEYEGIIPVLTKAIQEQQSQIEYLKKRLEQLEGN